MRHVVRDGNASMDRPITAEERRATLTRRIAIGVVVTVATVFVFAGTVEWLRPSIDRDAIVQLAYEGTTIPAQGIWPSYDAVTPYMDAVSDLYEEYPDFNIDIENVCAVSAGNRNKTDLIN